MAIVSYALVSLDELKEFLGITSNSKDDLLTNIINRATDTIETYCNGRRFKETDYTQEEYDGTGTSFINLRHYPVTDLSNPERNLGTPGDPSWTTIESEFIKRIDDGRGPGQVHKQGGFFNGVRNFRFDYTAGYDPIPNDLKEACLEFCSYIYSDRNRKGLQSETLGEYSYTKSPRTDNLFKDLNINLILDNYRTPVV